MYPPDPNNPSATCNDQSIVSGGGASAASATAGTTGGGEPTTTAGAGGTIYFCSMPSPWKCADLEPDAALTNLPAYPDPYTKPDDPLHAKWDACWSAVEADESPYLSKCVDAPSELAARTGCQDLCNDWRMAMEAACAKDVDCKVVTTVDCALDGTYVNNMGKEVVGDLPGEQPVKKAELPNYACDGEPVTVGEGA